MTTFTDAFGRTVAVNEANGAYTVTGPGGLEYSGQLAGGDAAVLQLVNSMRPAYYTPPPAPPVTTIDALDFIQRFTGAEQGALVAADPLWGIEIAAAGTIDVTNPLLLAQMTAAVSANLLTSARMTQVLNLAVASP